MSYTPIENKPVILDADQAREVKSKIYNYLGITEPIVNSSYTEDQYSAFYESTIEPIATALSQEFTAKLFNSRELAYGNSILFESGRLQFTSNATKVQLIKELMPMGLLTINQALEILNLPSVTDGDKRLQALNMIDAAQAAVAVGILECRVLEIESRIDKADGDALAGVSFFKAGNAAVNQAHASLHKRDIGFQLPFTGRVHLGNALDGNKGINLVDRNADHSLMPEF